MLAVLECRLGQLVVGPYRGHNRNGIDLPRPQHFGKIGRQVETGIDTVGPLQRRRALVAHRDDLCVLEAMEVPDDVRAPVAVPDDADADRVGRVVGARLKCMGMLRKLHFRSGGCEPLGAVACHSELPESVCTVRSTRAGFPATID